MDIDAIPVTSWECFENLGPEELEDLEVSLYGMLHHSYGDGDDHFEPRMPPLTATTVQRPNSPSPLGLSLARPTPFSTVNHHNICPQQETAGKLNPKAQTGNRWDDSGLSLKSSLKRNGEKSPEVAPSSRNQAHGMEKPRLSHNTGTSSKPSRRGRTNDMIEVITLLDDEEDSRYAAVNKCSASKMISPSCSGSRPSKGSRASLPIVSSDSEDCVIVLESVRKTNAPKAIESDSESSDAEYFRISNRGESPVPGDLKINVSGSQGNLLNGSSYSTDNTPGSPGFEAYAATKWTREMIAFYNGDANCVDMEAISRSFPKNATWHLNDADRFGQKLKNRYFLKQSNERCANCHQRDHATRHCKEPKKEVTCTVCGERGHRVFACPRKVCLGCGRPSKVYIECCPDCRRERNVTCMICRLNHVTERCPDLWRRYHSTTEEHKSLTPSSENLKPTRTLQCCNCSSRGHTAFNCPKVLWTKYPIANPVVLSYQDARAFFESATRDGTKNAPVSEDRKAISVVSQPGEDSSSLDEGFQEAPRSQRKTYRIRTKDFTEEQIRAAMDQVVAQFEGYNIFRRKDPKEKDFTYFDFTGPRNDQAIERFKKSLPHSVKQEKGQKRNKEQKKEPAGKPITTVTVRLLDRCPRKMRLCKGLSPKEKASFGTLLTKLEAKHCVAITSSVAGNVWELFVNQLNGRGNTKGAFVSILRVLEGKCR